MCYWIIGIDPGVGGGIAIVPWPGGPLRDQQTEVYPWTTTGDMAAILADYAGNLDDSRLATAYIEEVNAQPQNAVRSAFKFGHNCGCWEGLLVGYGISFGRVRPTVWQRGLRIPKRGKKEASTPWKNRLKRMAQELFPSVKVTLKIADALLIAEYGRRQTYLLSTSSASTPLES